MQQQQQQPNSSPAHYNNTAEQSDRTITLPLTQASLRNHLDNKKKRKKKKTKGDSGGGDGDARQGEVVTMRMLCMLPSHLARERRAEAGDVNDDDDNDAASHTRRKDELNDWLARHVVDFFNTLSLLYNSVSERCTAVRCPVMSGADRKGKQREFRWPRHLVLDDDEAGAAAVAAEAATAAITGGGGGGGGGGAETSGDDTEIDSGEVRIDMPSNATTTTTGVEKSKAPPRKQLRRPLRCSAPQYVSYLLEWTESQMANPDVFPLRKVDPFPPRFAVDVVAPIFYRLSRVYAHL
jgi:hypothetical protein